MILKEKLEEISTLIRCCDAIDFWVYTEEMHLIDNIGIREQYVLHTFFERPFPKQEIQNHFASQNAPLIFTDQLGLMYCAIQTKLPHVEPEVADLRSVIIMGPVLSWPVTEEGVSELARNRNLPLSWRSNFIELILSLPFVSLNIFYRYTVLLNYAMTGQKIDRTEIRLVSVPEEARGNSKPASRSTDPKSKNTVEKLSSATQSNKRRMNVYLSEKELLDNIRNGNLNYVSSLNKASHSVTFTNNPTKNPLDKGKQSCIIFVSLCVRAAIEGGLSPEAAYSLGDTYISDIEHCSNLNDCRMINHAMYEDFVQRIHKLKENPGYSPQIQECIDYIDMHPEEKLTLHQLAGHIGYADTYLSRKFKQETGLSLVDYINQARINRAKQLLTDPAISISSIAEQLHFSTVSYFASIFQKYEGSTPQQYRKNKEK